tara:strand:+ start:3924 stop:4454 length:531 start_codon:yes stop_codon:yes gene_type:complete
MSLNINGNISDPSYRYQMPKLEITQIGTGKNSHTILSNIKDISSSLGHSDIIILKFIAIKLGTSIDNKKLSIKGHYDINILQKKIFDYINIYVICYNCSIPELIPELDIISKKKTQIKFKCSACGQFTQIKEHKNSKKIIDNIKKLVEKNQWIIKKGTIVTESLTQCTTSLDMFNL